MVKYLILRFKIQKHLPILNLLLLCVVKYHNVKPGYLRQIAHMYPISDSAPQSAYSATSDQAILIFINQNI